MAGMAEGKFLAVQCGEIRSLFRNRCVIQALEVNIFLIAEFGIDIITLQEANLSVLQTSSGRC